MNHHLPKSKYDIPEWLNRRGLNGKGVELGVLNGDFAMDLLHRWGGDKLYLIDSWRKIKFWDSKLNDSDQVQIGRMTETALKVARFGHKATIIRELSQDALTLFADNSLDFVYIDADHSEAGIRRDMQWFYKVRQGGVLMGHDYMDGVHEWEGTNYQVKTVVDQFCRNYNLNLHIIKESIDTEDSWLIIKE